MATNDLKMTKVKSFDEKIPRVGGQYPGEKP